MKLENLNPGSLKVAKYNPATRTDKHTLAALLESIKTHGILTPLTADKDKNLIDGHRRLACAKILKLETVPVFTSDSKLTNHETYEIVNTTSKKIATADMIYIYIHNGKKPAKQLKVIKQLEFLIGTAKLKEFGNNYVSPNVLRYARVVAKYCHDNTDTFLKKAVIWVVDHKMGFTVRRAIEDNINRATLKTVITSNRELKRDWK